MLRGPAGQQACPSAMEVTRAGDPRVEARGEQVRLAAAGGVGLAGALDRIVEAAGEPSPEDEGEVEEGTAVPVGKQFSSDRE